MFDSIEPLFFDRRQYLAVFDQRRGAIMQSKSHAIIFIDPFMTAVKSQY
jgi:hypothetical protein